jgi:hypothetical protein
MPLIARATAVCVLLLSPSLAAAQDAPVDAALVDALRLRRCGTARGAVIGAAGGALAGLGFAVFVCERVSEGQGCDAWDAVALITAGGAACGRPPAAAILEAFCRHAPRAPHHRSSA